MFKWSSYPEMDLKLVHSLFLLKYEQCRLKSDVQAMLHLAMLHVAFFSELTHNRCYMT